MKGQAHTHRWVPSGKKIHTCTVCGITRSSAAVSTEVKK